MDQQQSSGVEAKRYSPIALFLLVIALPLLIVPTSWIFLSGAKLLILSLLTLVPLSLWIVKRFLEGTLVVPASTILGVGAFVPIAYGIATIFSSAVGFSILSYTFSLDSFVVLFVAYALMVLVSVTLTTKKLQRRLLHILLYTFIATIIFAAIQIMAGLSWLPEALSFGGVITVGAWYDLAIFAGLIVLITLSIPAQGKMEQRLVHGTFWLALISMVVVNLQIGWILLAVFSALYVTYHFSHRRGTDVGSEQNPNQRSLEGVSKSGATTVPDVSARAHHHGFGRGITVFIVSVFFIFVGNTIGDSISTTLRISALDVRPSWSGTFEVARKVYGENAVFGTGPNTFSKQWVRYKPDGINQTQFWGVDFNQGIGFIPTSFITSGLVGVVAWILFLLSIIYAGAKILWKRGERTDDGAFPIPTALFLSVAYLWTMNMVYTPQLAMFIFAFLFTGLFVAAQADSGAIRRVRYQIARHSAASFVVTVVLAVLLIISIISLYVVAERSLTIHFLSRANSALVADDIATATKFVARADFFSNADVVQRAQTTLALGVLRQSLQSLTEASTEEERALVREDLSRAVQYALATTEADPNNYRNWLLLADIYSQLIPLGIEGSYESALGAYDTARQINPTSPFIPLQMARLEVGQGDIVSGRVFINQALALKPNYSEAYFYLSQIEIAEGNVDQAIASTEATATLVPNNPAIFFQLGLLQYNKEDYERAAAVLERAVGLNNDYANALYFLGLAYDKLDRKQDAIDMFARVEVLNPTNTEVKRILDNLQQGNAALEGIQTIPPEDRTRLPVSDIPAVTQ